MKATQVFTPGKLPDVTYIDAHLKDRATLLHDALDTGAAVISLSGPSKSGKTVFIEKNIGKDRLLQVTGAGITEASRLWDRVFDLIGTPTSKRTTTTTGVEKSLAGKVAGEGGIPLVAKASGEVSGGGKWTDSTALQADTPVDYLQLLIRELGGSGLVVFIDDFHYIPRAVQLEVANQIKEAIRNDVVFVVASVPYHADDVIRANADLRGRTVKLDFDYWEPAELGQIASKGFAELNATASAGYVDALAREAAGSPQLMQSLCLTTCFENDLREKHPAGPPKPMRSDIPAIETVCTRVVMTADYSSTVDKMTDGPKTRGTERNAYLTKDGDVIDVYPLILRAIAADPPQLTFRYADLQARIRTQCAKDQPSGSSVTGACAHIAAIANESENRSVVEWDGGSDVFDIHDPYLLFYLRWNE
ncbi:hypothetical protein [Cupriavidus sp. TMH.W2]|uniref:hypothetical protein n=1 Tax=Cupriavidus sp. TMH.W2 TaxID=3434465 RepID=UPI003D76DE29